MKSGSHFSTEINKASMLSVFSSLEKHPSSIVFFKFLANFVTSMEGKNIETETDMALPNSSSG